MWVSLSISLCVVCVCVCVFEGGPGSISQQISRPENPICLERQQAVHHLPWMDTISALSVTAPKHTPTHTHTMHPQPHTHKLYIYLSMTTCMNEHTHPHTQPTVTETDRHYYHSSCGRRWREKLNTLKTLSSFTLMQMLTAVTVTLLLTTASYSPVFRLLISAPIMTHIPANGTILSERLAHLDHLRLQMLLKIVLL